MKQEALLGILVFIFVMWLLLKDKDEIYFSLSLPDSSGVSVGGRNLRLNQEFNGDRKFQRLT